MRFYPMNEIYRQRIQRQEGEFGGLIDTGEGVTEWILHICFLRKADPSLHKVKEKADEDAPSKEVHWILRIQHVQVRDLRPWEEDAEWMCGAYIQGHLAELGRHSKRGNGTIPHPEFGGGELKGLQCRELGCWKRKYGLQNGFEAGLNI